MKNKCSIKGSDNCVIQNAEESCQNCTENSAETWDSIAVTILCVFHFLLGAAAYKWVLWRWLP